MMNSKRFYVAAIIVLVYLAVKGSGANSDSPNYRPLACPDRCNLKHGFCQPSGQCSCYPGWEGDDCNQCTRAPGCMHGSCDQPWQCNCEEGYGGRHCQLDLQFCERHQPCHNGATCVNDEKGSYTCVCPEGYVGKTCGLPANPSTPIIRSTPNSPTFCLNGGTCTFGNDLVGCEKCSCPSGFAGNRCQSRVLMCVTRPCANGGRCYDLINDFRCECAKGYTGRYCTEDVDECAILGGDACENGGVCINRPGSYTCECQEGYEGARCDKNIRRFVAPPASTSSSSISTTLYPGKSSSTLYRSFDGRHPADDVINDAPKATSVKKQSSTNIKVTHIFKQVEVSNSDSAIVKHVISNSDLFPSSDKKSGDKSSVSIVQAVTFAFLGVAVVLFVGIGLFLWFHCNKRRKCGRKARSSEERCIAEDDESRSSIVRKAEGRQLSKYHKSSKKNNFQSKPGLVVRTITPSTEPRSVKSRQLVDCLYIALPSNPTPLEQLPISSIDETNELLKSSKMSRATNFYHLHR